MDDIKKIIREVIKETIDEKGSEKNPFTPEEQKVMDFLVDAQNSFSELETTHPSEEEDWTNAMHALQRLLGQRVLRRDYPDYFYSSKESDKND